MYYSQTSSNKEAKINQHKWDKEHRPKKRVKTKRQSKKEVFH